MTTMTMIRFKSICCLVDESRVCFRSHSHSHSNCCYSVPIEFYISCWILIECDFKRKRKKTKWSICDNIAFVSVKCEVFLLWHLFFMRAIGYTQTSLRIDAIVWFGLYGFQLNELVCHKIDQVAHVSISSNSTIRIFITGCSIWFFDRVLPKLTVNFFFLYKPNTEQKQNFKLRISFPHNQMNLKVT